MEYVAAQDKDSTVRGPALLRRNQAYAALRQFEDKSVEEFRELIYFAQKWAAGKKDNRSGWAQALLSIVSHGKGRGALLFQTFAQELVDSLVEKTGGRPVMIEVPELPEGQVVGMFGTAGRQLGQFNWNHGIACPSENELYAADLNNWRVQKLLLHPERARPSTGGR